ncbi:MAG: M1 family metallopeptidase [bacterium]|nr:M1 family metallopeptidase [bacterium]
MRRAKTFRVGMIGLLLALALASAGPSTAAVRLGDDVVPAFQAIQLHLDANRADYSGSVRIDLLVGKATDRFRFHSAGLTLGSVALRGTRGEIVIEHEPEADEMVAVRAGSPLVPGRYTLDIEFTNTFDPHAAGLFRVDKGGEQYVFSDLWPDDAREAFPCWDEPRFKIPFQITLRVPSSHLAVSNTPVAKETVGDGGRLVVFQKTRPLPTYLLAIATGPLETVPIPGLSVPGRVVTVRGEGRLAAGAVAATPPILRALEQYFGSPYPFAKLDLIAIPEFWGGAMENAGAVTFADHLLLLDPAAAGVRERGLQARLIAHELAHMWFGDLVTMEWWDDLWLSESFADLMDTKITQQVFPEFGSAVAMVESAQGVEGIMELDARATTTAIRKPIESPKYMPDLRLAYSKGRSVLALFEQWLGPEAFRRGLIDYLDANAWGNATAPQLWQALERASGKQVAAALGSFLEQPGYPLIAVECLADGRVKLSQRRFRNQGTTSPELTWQVPVTLKYAHDGRVLTTKVLLDTESRIVSLESPAEPRGGPEWIYPNASAHGYYRWSVPEGSLRELARNATSVLSPRERVELLGNLSALLAAGRLHGDAYLDLLREFAEDPHPLVVRSLIDALEEVKRAFVTAELQEPFAAYVESTLGPALERFGLEKAAAEEETVSLVRPRLVWFLGKEGRDPRLIRHAQALARAIMEDGATAVDPSLINVALELAAVAGDRELFDQYRKRFESAGADRDRYLMALGAFETAELRRTALRYALEGPVPPTDILTIARRRGMADDAEGRAVRYRWMTENYGRIVARLPLGRVRIMPIFAGGCSRERLEAARAFFAVPEHRVPGPPHLSPSGGTPEELEKVAEEVTDCVRLREREGDAAARYLAAAMPREP